jgi:hypothetical protein
LEIEMTDLKNTFVVLWDPTTSQECLDLYVKAGFIPCIGLGPFQIRIAAASNIQTKEITLDELREAVNGYQPKPGEVCESLCGKDTWQKVVLLEDGNFYARTVAPKEFRPIKTERDLWVEKAASLEGLGSIYDALKSGELDCPK